MYTITTICHCMVNYYINVALIKHRWVPVYIKVFVMWFIDKSIVKKISHEVNNDLRNHIRIHAVGDILYMRQM